MIDRHTDFVDANSPASLDGADNRGEHGRGRVVQLSFGFGVARKLFAGIRHVMAFDSKAFFFAGATNNIHATCRPQVLDGPRALGPICPYATPGNRALLRHGQ